MTCSEIESIIDKFNLFTEKPVKFLTVQNDRKDDLKSFVKSLYDFTKEHEQSENREKKGALPKLIIEDFDEEQIWQEIELQNSECWDQLVWDVANCMSTKSDLLFPVQTSNNDESIQEEENAVSEDENELSDDDENITKELKKKVTAKLKTKSKPSVVDDKFFKLQDMEKFLLNEEKKDSNKLATDSDEESINMFEDIDDDDDGGSDEEMGGTDVKYNDFFDHDGEQEDYPEEMDDEEQEMDDEEQRLENEESYDKPNNKNNKKVRFAKESSDDDSEDIEPETNKEKITDDEKKSEFELRQQRLKQQIERLEEKTLKEAPWQLKGEIDATKRPQNSLLQEVVDFDLTTRPPPIITEQTTITLEDIIMRRIKDKTWDDVVKKDKPVDDQLSFRKTEVIDHSKSKLSLAQVYEAEYLKQKKALSGDNEEEKEPESHTQIRDAMSKLFTKLDALCHYHYTPKAPHAEVKIVTNTPAISMEEVAPVATSDAALLAPEEVKKKRRGDLISKEERTQTDKNRERRKKKKLQREKGMPTKVTEHRNTKKGVKANDKSLKTSKAFFQQLNDDATSLINKNKVKRNVKNKGQ